MSCSRVRRSAGLSGPRRRRVVTRGPAFRGAPVVTRARVGRRSGRSGRTGVCCRFREVGALFGGSFGSGVMSPPGLGRRLVARLSAEGALLGLEVGGRRWWWWWSGVPGRLSVDVGVAAAVRRGRAGVLLACADAGDGRLSQSRHAHSVPVLAFGVVEWSSVRRSVHGATSDSHGTAPSRRPRSCCTPRMDSGGRGWSRRRQLLVVASVVSRLSAPSPPKTRCSLVLVGVPLLSACGSRHFAPPEGRHHPRVKGASMMAADPFSSFHFTGLPAVVSGRLVLWTTRGQPYCETHYHAKRGSLCAGCNKPITGERHGLSAKSDLPRRALSNQICRVGLCPPIEAVASNVSANQLMGTRPANQSAHGHPTCPWTPDLSSNQLMGTRPTRQSAHGHPTCPANQLMGTQPANQSANGYPACPPISSWALGLPANQLIRRSCPITPSIVAASDPAALPFCPPPPPTDSPWQLKANRPVFREPPPLCVQCSAAGRPCSASRSCYGRRRCSVWSGGRE